MLTRLRIVYLSLSIKKKGCLEAHVDKIRSLALEAIFCILSRLFIRVRKIKNNLANASITQGIFKPLIASD